MNIPIKCAIALIFSAATIFHVYLAKRRKRGSWRSRLNWSRADRNWQRFASHCTNRLEGKRHGDLVNKIITILLLNGGIFPDYHSLEEPPGRNSFLVVEAYAVLFNRVWALWKRIPSHAVLLTGQPGIGASQSFPYILSLLTLPHGREHGYSMP